MRKLFKIMRSMNYASESVDMWEGGITGLLASFRRYVKLFVNSKLFDNGMMICVFINTIILACDGLTNSEGEAILNRFNFAFTIIFTIDMSFKLLGLGFVEYLRDKMNIFDAIIVILSLIELAIFGDGGGSAISAFRSVRIFRTFRVLRVTRLIRSLEYMRIIM
jgi:hypothetical protein